MGIFDILLEAGLGFLGGALDTSQEDANKTALQVAQTQARKAYPGQKSLAKALTPYLWENLNVGLSESEKQLYRGEARTGVLQSLKGSSAQISKMAAAQGLKGGSIANILSQVESSKYPAFAQIETGIMKEDVSRKNKRIEDILKFLSLVAGEGEEANLADLYTANPTIEDIINKRISEIPQPMPIYYGGGGDGGFGGYGY